MDNRTKEKGERSYSSEMEKKKEKEDSSQIIINKSIYFLRILLRLWGRKRMAEVCLTSAPVDERRKLSKKGALNAFVISPDETMLPLFLEKSCFLSALIF